MDEPEAGASEMQLREQGCVLQPFQEVLRPLQAQLLALEKLAFANTETVFSVHS